jgi:5'-nucleotidase
MRILITNDDGVNSPVLPALARFARRFGEVTVIAPKVEQSGMSHAIDFIHPIEIKKVMIAPDVEAYSMDSTPADCVRFGVLGLKERFDLVLSGINRGYNLGSDIVYSGTVAAIFEAARLGVKGIALSAEPAHFEAAAEKLPEVFEYIEKQGLLDRGSWYNINIPSEIKDIKVTRQGGIFFTDRFINTEGNIFVQEGEQAQTVAHDTTLDIDAVISGFVSITPLLATRTDDELFKKLTKSK